MTLSRSPVRWLRAVFFGALSIWWFQGSVRDIFEKHGGDVLDFLNMHGWRWNVPKVTVTALLAAFAYSRAHTLRRRIFTSVFNAAALAYCGWDLWRFVPYNCFNIVPGLQPDRITVCTRILGINLTAAYLCAWDLAAVVRTAEARTVWMRQVPVFAGLFLLGVGPAVYHADAVIVEHRSMYEESMRGIRGEPAYDIVKGAFRIGETEETVVGPLDLPGVDTSWHVGLLPTFGTTDGPVRVIAYRIRDGAQRFLFGLYDPATGEVEHGAIDLPVPPARGRTISTTATATVCAFIESPSETSGRLVLLARDGRRLAGIPMADALDIVAWTGERTLLVAKTDWATHEVTYRAPDGSETTVRSYPEAAGHRIVTFRPGPDRWTVERSEEIPRFEEPPDFEGGRTSPRVALVVPGAARAVAFRDPVRSTEGNREEWIYDLDRKETSPRGVLISGRSPMTRWTAPDPACYGRTAMFTPEQAEKPAPGLSFTLSGDSVPRIVRNGREEVDTEAIIEIIRKMREADTAAEPVVEIRSREKIELVCGGEIYEVEEMPEQMRTRSGYSYPGWDFFRFSGPSGPFTRETPRPASRWSFRAVEHATRTVYRLDGEDRRGWAPWFFNFDEANRRILYASPEDGRWVVRAVRFEA